MQKFTDFLNQIHFTDPVLVENITETYNLLFETTATQQALDKANEVVHDTTEKYKESHGMVDDEFTSMGIDELLGDDMNDPSQDAEFDLETDISEDAPETAESDELVDLDIDDLLGETTTDEDTNGNEIGTDGETEEDTEQIQPKKDGEQEENTESSEAEANQPII